MYRWNSAEVWEFLYGIIKEKAHDLTEEECQAISDALNSRIKFEERDLER